MNYIRVYKHMDVYVWITYKLVSVWVCMCELHVCKCMDLYVWTMYVSIWMCIYELCRCMCICVRVCIMYMCACMKLVCVCSQVWIHKCTQSNLFLGWSIFCGCYNCRWCGFCRTWSCCWRDCCWRRWCSVREVLHHKLFQVFIRLKPFDGGQCRGRWCHCYMRCDMLWDVRFVYYWNLCYIVLVCCNSYRGQSKQGILWLYLWWHFLERQLWI